MTNRPFIIGIAGGSASGKSSVARAIIDKVGQSNMVHMCHDSYYKDRPHNGNNIEINYDHPNSLETDLMVHDLHKLVNGNTIYIPEYDYITHRRLSNKIPTMLRPIILLEGILIYNDINLRNMCNIKIYVDTEADERLIRRIRRDTLERGRTPEDVIQQYSKFVKPMHNQFVEPTKNFADIIIPSGYNEASVNMVVNSLENVIKI
jgi:uridine kinase